MLREYVVDLLRKKFPEPMLLADELIEIYSLVGFLEDKKIQKQLLQCWQLYFQDLLNPEQLDIQSALSGSTSHLWYLKKFMFMMYQAIIHKNYKQLSWIHSMLIVISDKLHVQLKLFFQYYREYLRWQQQFCQQQYQIAFTSLG